MCLDAQCSAAFENKSKETGYAHLNFRAAAAAAAHRPNNDDEMNGHKLLMQSLAA